MMIHAYDLPFARGQRLQDIPEIFVRDFDIQILERLEQTAAFVALENDLRPRDHHFITFPPHLFDEDGYLHLAARIDLEGPGDFRVFHLQRNVPARLADQPFAHVTRSNELPFTSGERRIVYQNPHSDGRRINVDKLQRWMFFAIGQRFADVNFFKTGQTDNIPNAGVLQLHLSHSGEGVEPGNAGALATAIAMDANDRISDTDATADNAAKGNASQVVAIVEIRNEHL